MTASKFQWLPPALLPVAFRLARADELAGELGDVCLSWSGDGDGAFDLAHQERVSGYHDLVVRSIRPIPPVAALLFSEAIAHLRAALDNVVYYLADQAHVGVLADADAARIQFIIREDAEAYDLSVERLAKRLPQLGPGHALGERMRSLQPFESSNCIASSPHRSTEGATGAATQASGGARPPAGAADGRVPHPAVLLQQYSNQDKHRNLRLASTRGTYVNDDGSHPSDELREIRVQDSLARNPIGAEYEVTVYAALGIERPNGGQWTSPTSELDQLSGWVGDVAIPTLVTGRMIVEAFPPQVDLRDHAITDAQRIATAGLDRALRRHVESTQAAQRETAAMMPKMPDLVQPPGDAAQR